jgi:hypothetical protein
MFIDIKIITIRNIIFENGKTLPRGSTEMDPSCEEAESSKRAMIVRRRRMLGFKIFFVEFWNLSLKDPYYQTSKRNTSGTVEE